MTATPEARSVVMEREFAHPPEKIWRALTETSLLDEWLLKNDFRPVVGHRFNFRTDPVGGWDGVVACEVLTVEPLRRLSYTWATGTGGPDVNSVVTWTLQPTSTGTRVRMEQSGFRPDQKRAEGGARYGWGLFFGGLEKVLARLT